MGETSRIISLFTLERGRLRCIAKGERKTASTKGGRLKLFALASCQIYQKENVELGTITSVELVDDFSAIGKVPLKFGLASAFCEFLEKGTEENQPLPEIYDLTGRFFTLIAGCKEDLAEQIFWAACLKMLDFSGYRPQLSECVVCGKKNSGRAAYYAPSKGGIICRKDVSTPEECSKISATGLKMLRRFLLEPLTKITDSRCSAKTLEEIERFILSFADYHMGLRRKLKSLKFLSQLKKKR